MMMRYRIQQDKGRYCLKGCEDGDLVDWSSYDALQRAYDRALEKLVLASSYMTLEAQQAFSDEWERRMRALNRPAEPTGDACEKSPTGTHITKIGGRCLYCGQNS